MGGGQWAMSNKPLVSVGGAGTTVAISLYASGWPEHIRAHPVEVALLAAAGVLLMLFGLWSPSRKSNPEQSIGGKRDTVDKSIGSSKTGHFGDTTQQAGTVGGNLVAAEHYHEAPKFPPPPPEPLLFPFRLNASPKFIFVAYENVVWAECAPNHPQAHEAVIVEYSRDVPHPGQRGPGAVVVLAILRIAHSSGLEHIPRAYWLKQRDYAVEFIGGHKETLILGTIDGPEFAAYTNPLRGELMEDAFSIPYRTLGPRTTVPKSGSITIEVSLYDAKKDETIQQDKFRVDFDGRSASIKIVP
jgi:hypothetical protein